MAGNDGDGTVPERPGLGLELDPIGLDRYRLDQYCIHLKMPNTDHHPLFPLKRTFAQPSLL